MTSALCLISTAGSTSGDSVQRNVEKISKLRNQDHASNNAASRMGGPIAGTAENDSLTKDQVLALKFRQRKNRKPMTQDRTQDRTQDQTQDFGCPQCQARYKVVRVKAGPQTINRPVHCKVCQRPFDSSDGEDILKYFLIDRPKAGSPRAR